MLYLLWMWPLITRLPALFCLNTGSHTHEHWPLTESQSWSELSCRLFPSSCTKGLSLTCLLPRQFLDYHPPTAVPKLLREVKTFSLPCLKNDCCCLFLVCSELGKRKSKLHWWTMEYVEEWLKISRLDWTHLSPSWHYQQGHKMFLFFMICCEF